MNTAILTSKQAFWALVLPVLALLGLQLFFFSPTTHAQDQSQVCLGTGGTPTTVNGEFVCERDGTGPSLFEDGGIFQSIVNVLLFIVGAISVIVLIINAIRFVVSGGDSNAVQAARNGILYAIVGVVIALSAYAIVDFALARLS